MNTQLSFFVALIAAGLSISFPFFLPCDESGQKAGCTQSQCVNYDPTARIDDGSCRECEPPPVCVLNPNFELEFDNVDCSVSLQNVAEAGCMFEVSTDNGTSWNSAKPDESISLTGTGTCDVLVRTVENPGEVLPYLGNTTCDCTPPVNDEAITRVVQDPMNQFLSSQECRCSDYTFVFPGNTRINAVEATLYLRMQSLNGQQYEVSEINHDTQEVQVVNRSAS